MLSSARRAATPRLPSRQGRRYATDRVLFASESSRSRRHPHAGRYRLVGGRSGDGYGHRDRHETGRGVAALECLCQRSGHRSEHHHSAGRQVHPAQGSCWTSDDRLSLAWLPAYGNPGDGRGREHCYGGRGARAGSGGTHRDRGAGRVAGTGANRRGTRRDLGCAARGSSEHVDNRAGTIGTPGGARR